MWQKLLSDLSQLCSLFLSLSLRKLHLNNYFILVFHLLFRPFSGVLWHEPPEAPHQRLRTACWKSSCAGMTWWCGTWLRNQSSESQLWLLWNQRVSSCQSRAAWIRPMCTSGCSLFKSACTIPPFIWYHFLQR